MGVTISQSYLKLHLLIFLCSPASGICRTNRILRRRSFVPIPPKSFFYNDHQFHRLSQRGLQRAKSATNTPRKGSQRIKVSEICCIYGEILLHRSKISKGISQGGATQCYLADFLILHVYFFTFSSSYISIKSILILKRFDKNLPLIFIFNS